MAQRKYKEKMEVRKSLDFGLKTDELPRYWMNNDPYKTRVFDAVQATFPDGERYFIAAVRAFRDGIQDPQLRAAVKDFMLQEGQHGQVHTDYNRWLQSQGIDIEAFTRHTQRVTNRRLKAMSPEYNIAMTAALEHFTAMMAELFFAEKSVMEGADKRLRALFAWHAVEEMEHRSVAFDVMQKVAGVGYARRTLAMTHATVAFTAYSLIAPYFMLKMDGFSLRERLAMGLKGTAWMLSPRKGLFVRLLPMIASYYKPGFHPDQQQAVHNYQAWIQAYAKDGDPIGAGDAMYAAAH